MIYKYIILICCLVICLTADAQSISDININPLVVDSMRKRDSLVVTLSKEHLVINFDYPEKVASGKANLYDVNGMELNTIIYNSNRFILDVQDYPNGVYFLKLIDAQLKEELTYKINKISQ